MGENNAWRDMAAERAKQVEIGYNAEQDDLHDAAEWMALLAGMLGEAGYQALDIREAAARGEEGKYTVRHKTRTFRWRMVKLSSVALAAAEAADRWLADPANE